jgi:hypothetical protein
MTEYMPHIARWKMPFLKLRLRIIARLTRKLNYFVVRHEFSPEDRKLYDMCFISHYHISHQDDAGASAGERLRFDHYMRKYGQELNHISSAIKGKNFDDVPKEVEDYVKKWQPLAQPPAFMVELIHGIDGQRLSQYPRTKHTDS